MRRAYTHVQQEMAAVNTGVEQGVAGMRVTQSLGRESFSIEQFETLSLRNMKANLRTAALFAALFPLMTVGNMLSIALVVGYGGVLGAGGSLTLGVILAFLGYVTRFFGPLRELSLVSNAMQAAAASLTRIQEYLQLPPEVAEPAQPRLPEGGLRGHIAFRNVTFAYEDEPVLCGVDFAVEAGEVLAIVGPTGAGKTTLGLLLSRLYDPEKGRIEIDGVGVDEISTRVLRAAVTVVPTTVRQAVEDRTGVAGGICRVTSPPSTTPWGGLTWPSGSSLRLDPDRADVLDRLGLLYIEQSLAILGAVLGDQDRLATAVEEHRMAVPLAPDDGWYQHYLGMGG